MIYIAPEKPIIVVDDEPSDRLIISSILARSNLQNPVEAIADGAELMTHMEAVAQGTLPMPALVLLDINMPGLSGFDVMRRIREHPEFVDKPLVAILTSSDAAADQLQASRTGADVFLTKQSGVAKFEEMFNAVFTNSTEESAE